VWGTPSEGEPARGTTLDTPQMKSTTTAAIAVCAISLALTANNYEAKTSMLPLLRLLQPPNKREALPAPDHSVALLPPTLNPFPIPDAASLTFALLVALVAMHVFSSADRPQTVQVQRRAVFSPHAPEGGDEARIRQLEGELQRMRTHAATLRARADALEAANRTLRDDLRVQTEALRAQNAALQNALQNALTPNGRIAALESLRSMTSEEFSLVWLNESSPEQLSLLREVGAVRAAHIIAHRPFSSVNQLATVAGLGGAGARRERVLLSLKARKPAAIG